MLSDSPGIGLRLRVFESLNPCSAGLCSLTVLQMYDNGELDQVLILVLLDYAL